MPLTRITRKIAPRILASGEKKTLATANTVYTVAVPPGAIALRLWIENSSGTRVRGRIGFAGEVHAPNATDSDTTLGFHEDGVEGYDLPSWAKVLHLASPTANAIAFLSWYYD